MSKFILKHGLTSEFINIQFNNRYVYIIDMIGESQTFGNIHLLLPNLTEDMGFLESFAPL